MSTISSWLHDSLKQKINISKMKFLPVFLTLLSVALCHRVFSGSDGKSVMYSISDVALSWIDAVKVWVSLMS
jgi:hypothetical protein